MIDPIKAIGPIKTIQLAGIDRVRERIAEIEERFGIAGDNSFQSTLEREMRKAQRTEKTQAAHQTKKSAEVGNVERAVDAVGASNVQSTPARSVDKLIEDADKLRDAELVSEFDNVEQILTADLTAGEVFAQLPGEEALNPFAAAAAVENPVPTRDTVREPLTVVEGAVFDNDDYNGNFGVPMTTEEMIEAAAAKYSVDPNLVKSIATAESDWNQNAISPVGAIGVMQLMPETAAALGVDPYNEQENIEGGAKYIRQMLDTFDGNVRKAIAAYNAGPGAVQRYGGVPPYSETQNYVGRVLDLYE